MLDLLHHCKPCFEPSCFELLPSEIVDHFGDWCYWLVSVENKPGCPSLDHLKLVYIFFEVGVPNGGAVISYWPNESFICCFLYF